MRTPYASGARGLVCGLLLAHAGPLAAQQDHWEREVGRAFARAEPALTARGLHRIGPVHYGLLLDGASTWITLDVPPGSGLAVVGGCDDDCARLGLVLADGTGYELRADAGRSNAPVVQVSPSAPHGAYRVRVIMSSCRVSPCRFGIAVYAEPPGRGPP
jgi:hypothetical protein